MPDQSALQWKAANTANTSKNMFVCIYSSNGKKKKVHLDAHNPDSTPQNERDEQAKYCFLVEQAVL